MIYLSLLLYMAGNYLLKSVNHLFGLLKALLELHLNKEDVLLVDDLLLQMARDAHIDACGAGWAHEIKEIKEDIKTKCTYYVESVKELEDYIA